MSIICISENRSRELLPVAGVGDGSRRAVMAGNLEAAGAGPRGAVLTRFEDKNIHKLTMTRGEGYEIS